MWPTLKALEVLGGAATARKINEKVVDLEHLTEEQLNVRNRRYLVFRLNEARAILKATGAIDNRRGGVWSITDKGRRLTEADMAGIPGQLQVDPNLTAYPSFRRFRVPLVIASVVLVLCAVLGPIVFEVAPNVFGHGVVAGSMLLAVEGALVFSLFVLFAWAVSVGARPWRESEGVSIAQRVFITVVVFAAGLVLFAMMLGATLYAFGVRMG